MMEIERAIRSERPQAMQAVAGTAAYPRRAGLVALGFALAFLVVFVTPPFTPWQFAPYSLVRWGDVIDLATPIVMLPVYWLVLVYGQEALHRWEIAAFLVLGAIWVEGQGMHLAANSIGHLIDTGPAGQLTNFYDERLGHILWHGAALGLSGLVAFCGLRSTPISTTPGRLLGLAGAAVYGFAFFLIAVEGGTSILALAGGAIVIAIAASKGLRAMISRPKTALFGVGYPVMALLLGIWFVYWGGSLPEFSSLGIIK